MTVNTNRRRSAIAICAGIALLAALWAMPAGAHDPAHPPYPGWEHIKCACRANGHSYEVGQQVCLKTPAGLRLAECRLSQNVTTWALQSEGCDVSAQLPSTPIPGRS
jgi:hypothetical protein